VLFSLCENAGERLRERKQRTGRAELRIRYADYVENQNTFSLNPPTQLSSTLYARALPVLDLVLKRRTRVRSMHLRLTDLSLGSVQLNLFSDPKPERREKLELALDALRHRYGKTVVSPQSSVESSRLLLPATGDRRPATGDRRLATDDWRLTTGD
jgi:DNA polymerase IV